MRNSLAIKDGSITSPIKKLPIATALVLALTTPAVIGAPAARQIEEIIVTAERQEASIQDTSISITAFTSEMLDSFGIRNQEDLQNFIPATTIQPYDATIRGVGRNFRALGGDPGVATYMNQIYSEDLLTATAATFWDVKRIEVLRGPQGTLYGRNAIGGAINILYEDASQEFDYAVKAISGNFDTQEVYGMVNGSIIEDVLSGRFNFAYRDRDGTIDEKGRGPDQDSLDTKNFAFIFDLTPVDGWEFKVRANKMEIDRVFAGANGGGAVILNEFNEPFRDTTHLVPGFRAIDTNNTDVANFLDQNWYDQNQPILNFTDPATGEVVQAQHNRGGIDLAEFDGFQNAAASLDGFNQTSDASADRLNSCVFSGDIDGDDVCVFTNGLNREEFDQQGVQFEAAWDVTDTLLVKYLYGYNKLSYQRTTDDDNTASQFHDRQFYVNHEAVYESHEIQAFYEFGDNLSFTSGLFIYDSTIDQRGDFYSSVGERRFIDPFQDNTGLASAFFGDGPTATLHSAKALCQVANPAPSCARNFAVKNSPLTNGVESNNLHIAQWFGDDGTNPDLDVQHGINTQGSDLLYHTKTVKDAFAAYTQGVWDINQDFTLTVGLRYAKDELEAEENLFRYSEVAGGILDSGAIPGLDVAVFNLLNGGIVPDPDNPGQFIPTTKATNGGIPVSLSVYRPFDRTDEELTWRVNLDWNVTDNTLLYFSVTTGTRAGGYNLVFFSQTPTYEPEELIAYEIGYKTTFFNDTLQFFGSTYYYDYEKIHTVALEVTPSLVAGGATGTTTSTLTAPGAEIFGIEIETMWLATDRWTFGGNFSYTPSEYNEDFFIKDEASLTAPESLFGNVESLVSNINGNQLLQVPEIKYTAWASYRWPLAGGSSIELFSVYSYTDEVFYSPFESETKKAEEYDRIDLRATWTSAGGSWVVSGFVNNILDELGQIQVLSADEAENFRVSGSTTVPRLYGVEVSYALGH